MVVERFPRKKNSAPSAPGLSIHLLCYFSLKRPYCAPLVVQVNELASRSLLVFALRAELHRSNPRPPLRYRSATAFGSQVIQQCSKHCFVALRYRSVLHRQVASQLPAAIVLPPHPSTCASTLLFLCLYTF